MLIHPLADRTTRTVRPLLLAAVALLAIAVLAASAPAAQSTAAGAAAKKPTIVLVHGAWADASSWFGVAQRLQRDGYTVVAPPNTLRGIAPDSDYLAAYLTTIRGPVVLAGHSYGGAVTTNAATGDANVKALVYVDAFIPDRGESLLSLLTPRDPTQPGVDPRTLFDLVPFPGAPAGDFDTYLKPSVVRTAFAADLSKRQAALLAATQRPLTLNALTDVSGEPAWKTIRSWAVVGTEDKLIPPPLQTFMAQRARATITRVDSSHVSLISHPGAVAKVIVRAAKTVR